MSIGQAVHCRTIGKGENLVLLHGWGVNSLVWQPVIEQLSKHFCLHLVDLPGFGESKGLSEYTLKSIVDAIFEVVPEHAVWCGWSLGGLLATYASYYSPERVSKLIQVCSPVKFVSEASWPGVEPSVFDKFKQGLEANKSKTLARFISIQAMGCVSARQDASALKKLLEQTTEADTNALLAGLALLNNTDLRKEFSLLLQPCLSLFGKFDSLLPAQTRINMQQLLPNAEQVVFEKSAHAPFVSETEKFNKSVINFLCD